MVKSYIFAKRSFQNTQGVFGADCTHVATEYTCFTKCF